MINNITQLIHKKLLIYSTNVLQIVQANRVRDKIVILSLNPLKAAVSNSISTIILKLLSRNISNQLTELLNILFCLGFFSLNPKILQSHSYI